MNGPTPDEIQAARRIVEIADCGNNGHQPDTAVRAWGSASLGEIYCRCHQVRWVPQMIATAGGAVGEDR